MIVLALISFYF